MTLTYKHYLGIFINNKIYIAMNTSLLLHLKKLQDTFEKDKFEENIQIINPAYSYILELQEDYFPAGIKYFYLSSENYSYLGANYIPVKIKSEFLNKVHKLWYFKNTEEDVLMNLIRDYVIRVEMIE